MPALFLRSHGHQQTYWTFEDTLSQTRLRLLLPLPALARRGRRTQAAALGADPGRLLGGVRALPAAGPTSNYGAAGVTREWAAPATALHVVFLTAHWTTSTATPAWAFRPLVLNLFRCENTVSRASRRRLLDPSASSDAGEDGPRPARGRLALATRRPWRKLLRLLVGGAVCFTGRPNSRLLRDSAPSVKIDLDAGVGGW